MTGDPDKDAEEVRRHVEATNARKAEVARQRYHRMAVDERRVYNRRQESGIPDLACLTLCSRFRRTESLRRRRMEEEALLSTPAGQISAEALQKAQQIMVSRVGR